MLRRILYLAIKEMSTVANDVIIVTSSLTRDMTGKEDSHRGPAIRALCKITDVRSQICFLRAEENKRISLKLINVFRSGIDDTKH